MSAALDRPLTVQDRDRLVGYLRLVESLLTCPETARRLLDGLTYALENR